jgi:sugar O-acyltransferase (sialic acid O-acetyltransferase NeuD family)
MNKEFYIIGSGGFAKEVLFLAEVVFGNTDDFRGFIDYKPSNLEVNCMGKKFPIIDEDEFLIKHQEVDRPAIYHGIGNPNLRKKLVEKFIDFPSPNLIHPNFVGHIPSISLGTGNIITSGCTLTVDIEIDSYNILNLHTTIGHDCRVGNFNVINPGCNISGNVTIGDSNLIGTNATILQGVSIGHNSTVGAGSLVRKDVPSDTIVVGIPAKPMVK